MLGGRESGPLYNVIEIDRYNIVIVLSFIKTVTKQNTFGEIRRSLNRNQNPCVILRDSSMIPHVLHSKMNRIG